MRSIFKIALTTVVLAVGGNALADDYIAAYTCKMKDGKEVEDVLAANAAWLKWVRANVNEKIDSHVGTAVVGKFDMFLFVDSYPDLATWAATVGALEDAPEEIENGLDGVADCTENRLWRMRPTP